MGLSIKKMEGIILLLFKIGLFCLVSGYELKQVVMLSRHNVRTPLSHDLTSITPKPWPQWSNKPGELTEKGALLEGYMGIYFSSWFQNKGLLHKEKCPNEDDFFAYANNKQRTIASAEAFIAKAFPNCNITVYHANGSIKDANFNPVIHDSSDSFKENAKKEMEERLLEVNVQSSLKRLQKILDYKQSNDCKVNNKCDLTTDKSTIEDLIMFEEPEVMGPLHIGNTVVDTFKMQYYEGMLMQNVAWGEMADPKLWNEIMAINIAYHNIRFNTTLVAKDISTPLIRYIKNLFVNENNHPKISLLMGHDANLYTVFNSLDFKPFLLNDQHEKTPVGGKIVFQKWWDPENSKFLLKIEYVYQSSVQLRKAVELDIDNPPKTLLFELKDCKVDENGFCPWNDFMKIIDNF